MTSIVQRILADMSRDAEKEAKRCRDNVATIARATGNQPDAESSWCMESETQRAIVLEQLSEAFKKSSETIKSEP